MSSYYVGLQVSLQWTLFIQKKYFMISESGEKQEKALNNDKNYIFLSKIKRRGSNLKKRSEFYKDCIQACIQPPISKCDKFRFLLYIGSAQLIRRRVKLDQLWICFSFWWNIFNNRLTAVRVDICYSLSWCLYWESFIAFNFIYISNKTLGPPSVKWVLLLWAPPILAAILCNAPPL